jgi:hypothetical protein
MSFKSLLNQTCIYSANTSTNRYGDLDYTGSRTIKCRFVKGFSKDQFNQGEINNRSAVLQIDTTVAPSIGSKVKFNNLVYNIDNIDEWRLGNGQLLGYKLTISEYV